LAPMLCARLLKPENGRKYGRIYAMDDATFECMKRGYDASLKWTLKHQRFTMHGGRGVGRG
jgi:multidrug efflux pump subunit AcrB